jgi:hypothetical protein
VRLRGQEEHIGEGMAARIRLSLAYLQEAIGTPGMELQLHATTLYNSIYRLDADMLVNSHAYGSFAVDHCSAFDAYAIGWSSSTNSGRSCNAPQPASMDQIYHFLLVSVTGAQVTVTPIDELGRAFDVQTYAF